MLTEAVIQTSTPTSLKINDADPSEILILEGISNLSSVKVDQFIGDFAREGSYYQGRRAGRRNPVFRFKLNPNYKEDIEVSDVREMLYRMFMEPLRDSDGVQVLLKDDRRPDRYFIGYTDSIESDQWTKEQKAQVSLITTDAYLRSAVPVQVINPKGWYKLPLKYEGSADTGISTTLKVIGMTDVVTFQNGPDKMILEGSFVPDDVFVINTLEGEREILLNGVDKMSAMTASSKWVQLNEQNNVLSAYGPTEGDGRAVITSYSYRAAWWGV